jgi:hypothetical protein
MCYELGHIFGHFAIDGRFLAAEPYGTGHINDTYLGRFETVGGVSSYIHQRINRKVFHRPEQVMENIQRVTCHLRERITADGGDPERESLTLVPTWGGVPFHIDDSGDCWRTYRFIPGARTYDELQEPRQIYEAARAFGRFQRQLADLPGPRLHETIARFHYTPRRLADFLAALDRDSENRAKDVRPEIDFVLARCDHASVLTDLLERGELPERITHNDTKLNNVMLDDKTGEAICVIDLDTVMPGLVHYDFGDAVRIGASTAAEDERDLSKVGLDMDAFAQLTRGYLETARGFLCSAEVEHLAFSCVLLTLECGMRFLADHLEGDVYFKIHRPGHNLDRARTQFKMIAEMEARMDEMEGLVRQYAGGDRG